MIKDNSKETVSFDKKPPNITSLIIKKFTCYIGSEWHKGLLFFLCTSIKLSLELVFVLNIKESSKAENVSLTILALLLYFINTFLCFKCLIGNPGILPANNYLQSLLPPTKKPKWYVLKGRVFKLKHCTTCFIVRPLGSGHCKKCNVCVERYDHHCPWVGACIGRNNYKYFFFLLISINLSSISSLAEDLICFINIYNCFQNEGIADMNCQIRYTFDISAQEDNATHINYKDVIKASMYISLIMSIVNSVLLFVFVLLLRHLSFLSRNETTYMRVKMKNFLQVYGNHFDKGLCFNVKANLFRAFLIRTRKKVKYYKSIAKANPVLLQKMNESNYPINVSYNCYVSYNSRGGMSNGELQQGTSIPKSNEGLGTMNRISKSPKIHEAFSNISKSFEEDVYSQQNTLIQYKTDNASYSYYKSKNWSLKDPNNLKPNVFFANHEEDRASNCIPNAIGFNS